MTFIGDKMNYTKLQDFRNKFAASTTTFRFNRFVSESEIKDNKLCGTVCCAAGDIPNLYPDEVSIQGQGDYTPVYKGETYTSWHSFLADFFEATNNEGFNIIERIFFGINDNYDSYGKEASDVTKADVLAMLDRVIAAKGDYDLP